MANTYIYNEVTSGAIDGVNKVFTTINDIYRVEELYLGGLPYRSLSWDGNNIILNDAPPVGASISVDYFYNI